jgi:LacI family transcriptional regulator
MKPNRRRKPIRVALFIQDMGPYGERAAQAIAQFAKGRGNWRVDLATFGEITPQEIAAGKADGVIFGRWEPLPELLAALASSSVPAVDISGGDDVEIPPARVMPDDRGVGTAAAEHFLARGFEHFAYYGLPEKFNHRWEKSRRDGFRDALATHGLTTEVFNGSARDWNELHDDQHLAALSRWLIHLPKPCAILCCIDAFAYEILRLSREAGLIVPEDVAVCGVDNRLWICMLANPTITSIPLDGVQAGTRSAKLLADMMAGRAAPKQPVLIAPLPIEQRESTNAYAFKDADVVEALHFIRDHCHKPISIADILQAIPISRRSLEMRFKKITGQTLQAEIWRAHLDKARRLLLETNESIYDVAEHAGFHSAPTFNVMFRRAMGMTPTAFRRQARLAMR